MVCNHERLGICPIVYDLKEDIMIKKWINARMKERTSWDGAALIILGLMVLFLAPLAKIAAGIAIAYGAWTIWKKD
tara:strand:- start:1293 stop:1520 length:228 start_codon:yes stop_codon:yes gene_type:complete